MKTPTVTNDVTVLAPENTVASGPSLKEKRKRKPSVSDVRHEKISLNALITRNKGRDVWVICMYNFWSVYLICSVPVTLKKIKFVMMNKGDKTNTKFLNIKYIQMVSIKISDY